MNLKQPRQGLYWLSQENEVFEEYPRVERDFACLYRIDPYRLAAWQPTSVLERARDTAWCSFVLREVTSCECLYYQ